MKLTLRYILTLVLWCITTGCTSPTAELPTLTATIALPSASAPPAAQTATSTPVPTATPMPSATPTPIAPPTATDIAIGDLPVIALNTVDQVKPLIENLQGSANTVSWSADSQILAVTNRQEVFLYASSDFHLLKRLPIQEAFWVAFSPTVSTTLATTNELGLVQVWDVATESVLHEFKTAIFNGSPVFSPNGNWLAVGTSQDDVWVWDLTVGQQRYQLPVYEGDVFDVVFSSDSQTLISGSTDGGIDFWSLQSGKAVYASPAYRSAVWRLAYNPNWPELVATFYGEGIIQVWSTDPIKLLVTLGDDRQQEIESVAYSPNGQLLVAGGTVIQFWDRQTRHVAHTLAPCSCETYALAFSPDGRLLASVTNEGQVTVWAITP